MQKGKIKFNYRSPFLAMIIFYKRHMSPYIGRCPSTPTCSMYAYDAIQRWGVIVGIFLGSLRILRCNPFREGSFDPVRENYKGKIKWLV